MSLYILRLERPNGQTDYAAVSALSAEMAREFVMANEPYTDTVPSFVTEDEFNEQYEVAYLTTERN